MIVFYSRPFFQDNSCWKLHYSKYIHYTLSHSRGIANVWRLILSHFGGNLASSEIPRHLFELHLQVNSIVRHSWQWRAFDTFSPPSLCTIFLQSCVNGCLWSPGVEASVVSSTEIFRAISYCQGRTGSVAQLISTASAATLTTQPRNIGVVTLVTLFFSAEL